MNFKEGFLDLQRIFPKKGDLRRPPSWFGHGCLYVFIAVALFMFLNGIWHKMDDILVIIIMSLFFGLALEPIVIWLNKKGMNKKLATFICLFIIVSALVLAIVLFGNLFAAQLASLLSSAPTLYNSFQNWALTSFSVELPGSGQVASRVLESWGKDIGTQAIWASISLFSLLIGFLCVVLLVYYICSEGEGFRKKLVVWFEPSKQDWILSLWQLLQKNVGSYIGSRTILALLSTFFTSVFLIFINVPNWLPLALFMGIVSQFIPTVGTYLGGALPVLVAVANGGVVQGLIVLAFLTFYQQIENFIFTPKISSHALNINPAVAFLCVLLFGSVFGAIGAFLALPITATILTVFSVIVKHYPVDLTQRDLTKFETPLENVNNSNEETNSKK